MSETNTARRSYVSLPRRCAERLRLLWVPIALVVAALSMGITVTVAHTDAMSPVDEWVYIDYLFKLPTHGIVREGEHIGQEALHLMACNGVKPYGPMGQPCDTKHYEASKFPFHGTTSADAYTPFYFVTTELVGGAIHSITGISQLTSWRLTGPIWLALAMLLLYATLKRFRVPRLLILGLGLATIASPFSWWTYTYISTDAPSLALGLLTVLASLQFAEGKWSGWWLGGIAVGSVLFKVTNILGVCLAGLILLILWIDEMNSRRWHGWKASRTGVPRQRLSTLLIIAVCTVAGSAVAQIIWLMIRNSMAIGRPADQGISMQLSAQELISQITNFLPGTIVANVNLSGSTSFAYPIPSFVVLPLSWICIASVLGSFMALRRGHFHSEIIISVAIAALFFAPMLAVVLDLTTGSYFALPPRYGASILGAILLVAGIFIKNRAAIWIVLIYAAALYGVVFVTAPYFA